MSRVDSRKGFSLIEVLCAILILGIGVVGLTEGIAVALRSSREAHLQTAAMLEAAGLIDTWRAEGYLADGTTEGECSRGLARHRWRRTISRTDLDGLHEVVVAIEDGRTGQEICELRTLMFEVPTGSLGGDAARRRETERRQRGREVP